MVRLDDPALNLRNHGVRAADREQRQDKELQGNLEQQRGNHARFHQPSAIDTGQSPASIHSSGMRSSAMPTNAAAQITICHDTVLSGRASLSAVATIRPEADAETARQAPRTASM